MSSGTTLVTNSTLSGIVQVIKKTKRKVYSVKDIMDIFKKI
jgi:hypothetical protein